MPTFDSSGVAINYVDEGSGPAIVLVHGFASSLQGNWRATGIIDALLGAGRRVVALDCRGHGESGKPHNPEAYGGSAMGDDVIALMDHLGIAEADLMGYSMGGSISSSLLVHHPERFRGVILSGVGDALILGGNSRGRSEAIAGALEAEDRGASANASARAFRVFAERNGNDLTALAALQRSSRGGSDARKLAEASCPVMVLIGEGDTLVGPADQLAATIPGATLVKVPGDHITAVGQPAFGQAVLNFLARYSPVAA
jgi:pimeloyl-ACP methyl ester carboxylesterase